MEEGSAQVIFADAERLEKLSQLLESESQAINNLIRLVDSSFKKLDASWVGQDREKFERDFQEVRSDSNALFFNYSAPAQAAKQYEAMEDDVSEVIESWNH